MFSSLILLNTWHFCQCMHCAFLVETKISAKDSTKRKLKSIEEKDLLTPTVSSFGCCALIHDAMINVVVLQAIDDKYCLVDAYVCLYACWVTQLFSTYLGCRLSNSSNNQDFE